MKLRLALAFCAVALLPVVAAAGTKPEPPDETPAAIVRMTADRKFEPPVVTISPGQTVEWISEDPYAVHTVTGDPDAVDDPALVRLPKGAKPFRSGAMSYGAKSKYRFTVPGEYHYVCAPHESQMRGVIIVKAR